MSSKDLTDASEIEPQESTRLSRRRNRRKAEMVSVAIEMLASGGYQGLNMEEVADRADIAKTTLYHYFSSKDELVAEALAVLTDNVLERLAAARDRVDPDAHQERLRALVREQLRILTEGFPEVGSIFSWQATWPSAHDEARKQMRKRHDAVFRGVLEAGLAADELVFEDADVALQCLHGVLNSVSVWVGRLDGLKNYVDTSDAVEQSVMRMFGVCS